MPLARRKPGGNMAVGPAKTAALYTSVKWHFAPALSLIPEFSFL